MIFCARATRGLRRPSLDARSGRPIRPHPGRENERVWKEGSEPIDHPYCSQNAHAEGEEGHPRWSCAPRTRTLRRMGSEKAGTVSLLAEAPR